MIRRIIVLSMAVMLLSTVDIYAQQTFVYAPISIEEIQAIITWDDPDSGRRGVKLEIKKYFPQTRFEFYSDPLEVINDETIESAIWIKAGFQEGYYAGIIPGIAENYTGSKQKLTTVRITILYVDVALAREKIANGLDASKALESSGYVSFEGFEEHLNYQIVDLGASPPDIRYNTNPGDLRSIVSRQMRVFLSEGIIR